MRILIVGVSGFLGGHLFEHYQKKGHQILSSSYRSYKSDINIKEIEKTIKENSIDLIIIAGSSQNGTDDVEALKEIVNSNIFLPASIASITIRNSPNTCIVNFGSSWQIDEDGGNYPFNAYAASKSAAECFYDHFMLNGSRLATIRLYDTYGPNDKRNKIINLIADALIRQLPLGLTGGQQVLDLIHISDVMSAIDIVIEELLKSNGGVHLKYSIRSMAEVKVSTLVSLMRNILGENNKDKIQLGVRDYRERERFKLSPNGWPTPLSWTPKIDLKDGLEELLKERHKIYQIE